MGRGWQCGGVREGLAWGGFGNQEGCAIRRGGGGLRRGGSGNGERCDGVGRVGQ